MHLNLKRLGLLSGKAARMFAERADLTPQRIDLMLLIRSSRLTQTQLANRLCVIPCVVSRMLDALVDRGLVTREICEYDARARIAHLTPAGHQRLAICFPTATCHGAQDHGEITWLRWWRGPMARLGIRVDNVRRSRVPACFGTLALKHECYPELFLRHDTVANLLTRFAAPARAAP